MMGQCEQVPSVTSKFSRFVQRLGLAAKPPRQLLERARRIRLPFQPLPELDASIFWEDGPWLRQIIDLPRGALSGPIQEDKAKAHSALARLIHKEVSQLSKLDLRQIDGISGRSADAKAYPTFEAFAATPACRQLRVISYKDFQRTLRTALPDFEHGKPIDLRQASWLGERLYWVGDQQVEAFACAVAYARLRGLEVLLPCVLTDYRLDITGLHALDATYHAVAMPAQAWSDRAFMSLLLDAKVPYARLTLRNAGNSELLLLDKQIESANELGEGLKLAGAADVVQYLRNLPGITRFRLGHLPQEA